MTSRLRRDIARITRLRLLAESTTSATPSPSAPPTALFRRLTPLNVFALSWDHLSISMRYRFRSTVERRLTCHGLRTLLAMASTATSSSTTSASTATARPLLFAISLLLVLMICYRRLC